MTDQHAPNSSWSDEPLHNADIAGRAQFAQAVAARIDSVPSGKNSTVFGLVGPWGSGKTTLLRDIVGRLPAWTIVWFSPWSVTEGSITTEFVSALAEAFPKSRSLKKKLVAYSRFGAPLLATIPLVGGAASAIANHTLSELSKRPAWYSEFNKLSTEIAAQNKRVLMIVDDVDRLGGDELRSLLRVVRLLGRFTNVHYLMAYDQATIDAALSTTAATGAGSEFMEKIVQYPFEVPPAPMVVRRQWSRSILDTVSPATAVTSQLHTEQRDELVRVLASCLDTPRAADRLREQMQSLSALVAEAEVDIFDFTVLTWLRISHHQVWDHIRLHANDFLSWRESDSQETKQSRLDKIEIFVTRGQAKSVQDAVSYLFEPSGLAGYLADRKGRMQIARYFDRYFHVGLADDDVSERKTQIALSELSAGVSNSSEIMYLKSIILGQDQERSALALDVAGNFRKSGSNTSLEILDFIDTIRSELTADGTLFATRFSSAERWLAREIFIALETKLISLDVLISRFGYAFLTASAYAMRRSPSYDETQVKELYSDVVRRWTTDLSDEPLAATLARSELIHMTSLCIWVKDFKDHGGFLSSRIVDGETLIEAATAFVSYSEWVGHDVKYELNFREKEFRFSVTSTVVEAKLPQIPEVNKSPDYDISDRSNPNITNAQRRDFAIRSLNSLRTN